MSIFRLEELEENPEGSIRIFRKVSLKHWAWDAPSETIYYASLNDARLDRNRKKCPKHLIESETRRKKLFG